MQELVDDPDDPRLQIYMGLRDHVVRQARERAGGDMAGSFMAEGDRVIARALDAGHRLQSVLVDARHPVADFGRDAPIYAASPEVLTAVSGRPRLRDPIACFERPRPGEAAELLASARTVAVLEGIVNPTNVGVIMRCAAGLGIEAVLLDPTSCDPLYRRAVRVSMGEVFAVPHARLEPFPDGLHEIVLSGFRTVALTPDPGALEIGEVTRTSSDKLAIVLGTEGPGLSDEVIDAVDIQVRIPMAAGVDSLNVGSAAAVAFYALRTR